MEIHHRLRQARLAAGYETPQQAAEALGWNANTYKSHENGQRGLKKQEAVRKYARGFGCDFVWLLTGSGTKEGQEYIPVIGRVGAGAEIFPEFEQVPPDGLFEIEVSIPIKGEVLAFVVEGDSMLPRYDPGDVIICGAEGTSAEQIIGWEAVVHTTDGRRFLKKVRRGSKPGLFNLESHNASPIEDVKLNWAAEVDHVVRSGKYKPIPKVSREQLLQQFAATKRLRRAKGA